MAVAIFSVDRTRNAKNMMIAWAEPCKGDEKIARGGSVSEPPEKDDLPNIFCPVGATETNIPNEIATAMRQWGFRLPNCR